MRWLAFPHVSPFETRGVSHLTITVVKVCGGETAFFAKGSCVFAFSRLDPEGWVGAM